MSLWRVSVLLLDTQASFIVVPFGQIGMRMGRNTFANLRASRLPKVAEPIRSQFGIDRRMLDVLVTKPCLNRPSVMRRVGQGKATVCG